MTMSSSRAASRTLVPSGTVTSRLSIVSLGINSVVGGWPLGARLVKRTASFADVILDFIFIEPQQRFYRPHGAFSQGTERTTLDIFHLILEHRQVVVGRPAELDSVEQPGDGG